MSLEAGAALVADALVWDMVWPLEPVFGNDWAQLEIFRQAGVDIVSVTIAGDNHSAGEALRLVATARRHIAADPRLRLVTAIEDIGLARQHGELAVGIHLEGTRCFERDIALVEAFHTLGIRHTLLAFNQSNSAGGGCAEASDGGLTRFGRRLIGEMERVGMLLDLSHVGRRTSLEAIEIATRPVMFSHSNVDRIAPHWRNLTDDQIRACAATSGVVGISGSSGYLGDPQARSEAIGNHVDYVAQLVGPAHVGLGLDVVFDHDALNRWVRSRPDEWPGTSDPHWPGFRYARPAQLGEIVDVLLRRGWNESDLRGLLGGNHLRVCTATWTPTAPGRLLH